MCYKSQLLTPEGEIYQDRNKILLSSFYPQLVSTYTTEYSIIHKILTSRIRAVVWWISVVDPEEPALSYFVK